MTGQLTTLQYAATTAIIGRLCTSPTDVLDACAYLLPTSLNINKWCHRAIIRMAMLPKDHPLHKTINCKNTYEVKHHHVAIHHLLNYYNFDPNAIKKILAALCNPNLTGKLSFVIRIPVDRDSSIQEATNAEEEIQVYSDRSTIEGKVGAAAILMRAGRTMCLLHFHLGAEGKYTVHKVELIEILLGLHLISMKRKGWTSVALRSNNQATIKAFNSNLRCPGHHIMRAALQLAQQIQNKYKSKSKNKNKRSKYTLTLC